MPSSTIHQHSGVDVRGKLRRDFIEMHLHHFGVHRGQNQPNGNITSGAECAEDIGVFVPRVDGCTQADSLASPAACARSFLAYSAFVLTPEFDGFFWVRRLDFLDDFGKFFLNASIASASCLGCVGRAVI
jgi:hypothetical protein